MTDRRWTRDELIMALALYRTIAPKAPDPKSQEIKEFSDRLRALRPDLSGADPRYRSPASVVMKLMNFRSLDRHYGGQGLSGASLLDAQIWKEFERQSPALDDELLRTLSGPESLAEAQEGAEVWRLHIERERCPALARERKRIAKAVSGKLECEVCGFDFEACYGDRGADFIECHHTRPLSEGWSSRVTQLEELALLCANCHRIVHVRRPWLTVPELRSLIMARRSC